MVRLEALWGKSHADQGKYDDRKSGNLKRKIDLGMQYTKNGSPKRGQWQDLISFTGQNSPSQDHKDQYNDKHGERDAHFYGKLKRCAMGMLPDANHRNLAATVRRERPAEGA